MKSTPSTLPTKISTDVFQYASPKLKLGHACAIRNAGMVKMAPEATPSPMDPLVREMFSSSREPFQARMTAMLITAAGYVAATVMPARRPR